jgi:hypothetical protein
MPVPVLVFLPCGSVPVWAQFITGTGMLLCPYWYWHCCTLIQYQFGHSPLPILALNCASTCIGISAFWFSTSMGTVHYWHWHSIMVPVLVLAFLNLGSVPVLAHTITKTGIQKWCLYRYWQCCTLVQYRYGHSPLPVLALIFLVPVLAFPHLGSEPVEAQSIASTGIQKWCPYQYWHFCTLVQYQYGHIPLPELAFYNGARNGIRILYSGSVLVWAWVITGTGIQWCPFRNRHFWHFGSVPVWAHSITGTGI